MQPYEQPPLHEQPPPPDILIADGPEPICEAAAMPEQERPRGAAVPEPGAALSETETTAAPPLHMVMAGIGSIERGIAAIADTSARAMGEVREIHKLYHNEFAGRLKTMQDELDFFREIDRGRVFDGILGDVAKIYSDNEPVLDEITDPRALKRVRYMFMDILQILEVNGVHRHKSGAGDKRNARCCQIAERIATNDPQLHDTVALSHNTGFYKENRVLVKELVDVYLYSE